MHYCENCQTTIKGEWASCPLCTLPLNSANESDKRKESSFLNVPLRYNREKAKQVFFRVSLVVVALYFIITFFYPFQFFGLEYVLFGLLITWATIVIFIRKRNNFAKVIVYFLILISLASIYFDYVNGWRGWSITFVLPILSMASLLSIFIGMQFIDLKVHDYVLYLQLVAIYGIVPLIFLIMGWVGHPLASILSVILSLIMFIGVLINYRSLLINELQKRMHI